MKKKLLSVLLSVGLTLGAITGCGASKNNAAQGSSETAGSGEVEKIKVYLPTSGKADDLEMVTGGQKLSLCICIMS